MAAALEEPSTSGREAEHLPLGSNFAGLQPGKILTAVTALLKYVGSSTSAEKVLFQEDELLYLVSGFNEAVSGDDVCSALARMRARWPCAHGARRRPPCNASFWLKAVTLLLLQIIALKKTPQIPAHKHKPVRM